MRFARFGAALCLAATATLSFAQAYPARAIRLIVDTSPGGITDILARLSAEGLAQRTGQQVVVENKAGASGVVAVDYVVKSPPDGYTLLIAAGGNIVVQPFTTRSLPYDPQTDLVPIFNVAEVAHILVASGLLPVSNMAEFLAYAKANPGKVNYGSAGIGSPPHLSIELLQRVAGLKLVHVPYKGVGPAMPDIIANRIQLLSISLGSAGGNLKSGGIRALATGAKKRMTQLPDVPTAAEAGVPGWEMTAWFGIFGPKGVGPDVVRTVNERMQAVIDDPKAKQRLFEVGAEAVGGSQPAFLERWRSDFKLWGAVVKDAGIKME
jgi:tripartite-type tricarboxylate transporter receptor subunit TctC